MYRKLASWLYNVCCALAVVVTVSDSEVIDVGLELPLASGDARHDASTRKISFLFLSKFSFNHHLLVLLFFRRPNFYLTNSA
jgi:hypothetical protein